MLAPDKFAKNLKRLCERKNWRQADLARETGIKKQQLSRYWNGLQIPGREITKLLAEKLSASESELVGAEERERPDRIEAIRLILATDDDTLEIVLRQLRRSVGSESVPSGKVKPSSG